MDRPRQRPKFDLSSSVEADVIRQRIAEALATDRRLSGLALDDRLELTVAEVDQTFFSPQLTVDLMPAENGEEGVRTVLRCRFGPHPHVWTMYAAAYGATIFATLLALMWGWAQAILDQPAWALSFAPAGAVLAACIYGASLFGQALATSQMTMLRGVLERAAETVPVEDTATAEAAPA